MLSKYLPAHLGAGRVGISAPLRCFTISAKAGSPLLLPVPLGPHILRGETPLQRERRWGALGLLMPGCPVGGQWGCPGNAGRFSQGALCRVARQLAAPYQLSDKLQPNSEMAPPVFQFVV